MTLKATARSAAVAADGVPLDDPGFTPPPTTEDRLVRIRALGQRIDGHIQFMCAVGNLVGTSLEAKEKAVAIFHERLQALEQQLDRIKNNLRLE